MPPLDRVPEKPTQPPNIAEPPQPPPAYSAFTLAQKRWIVVVISFAGWFSSLSSFIYFPAIPALARDLDTTVDRVNLTVTAYFVMSGVFPAVVGGAADTLGRRPTFIACLAVYVAANVGLALQSSFGMLLFLRILQSAGISGTYAITYGAIGDLFTPSERGGYAGVVSFVLNTPPSIGPVLSGLLMQRWDWRAIFWFLAAISPCCLAVIVVCLPETARTVVGDGAGAAMPPWYCRPLWRVLVAPRAGASQEVQHNGTQKRPLRIPNPLRTLLLLRDPGTLIAVCVVAVYYTIYSCLQASLSTLFVEEYSTSSLATGLIYLPFGVACAIGAFASGKILDTEYRRTARKHDMPPVGDWRTEDGPGRFPIEEARLGSVRVTLFACCLFIAGYGWTVQFKVHMAVPLVLQFLIGLSMQGVFTTVSTLLVDTHPDESASAQAASNLVRCGTAGGGLALLDMVINRLGAGWSFVVAAGIGLLAVALLALLRRNGMAWRLAMRAQ